MPDRSTDPLDDATATPSDAAAPASADRPRSAEDWLAERGITREPIRIPSSPGRGAAPTDDRAHGPPPSAREAAQLATEAPPGAPGAARADVADGVGADGVDDGDQPTSGPGELGDEVARAMAFIRASTARTPASSGRLRRKLAARDVPAAAIRVALARAGDQGMVDDERMAAALADEARARGHAPRRIRADLRKREFDADVIDATLDRFNDRDPEAVAFDVAQRKARSYGDVDAETAFRRLVGHLARRGHNEHVARKVARMVVFDDREADRVAGR